MKKKESKKKFFLRISINRIESTRNGIKSTQIELCWNKFYETLSNEYVCFMFTSVLIYSVRPFSNRCAWISKNQLYAWTDHMLLLLSKCVMFMPPTPPPLHCCARYDSKRFTELKCSIERKTMKSSVAVFFSLSILIGISLQVICEIRSVYRLDKMYEIERSRADILMDKLAWPSGFSVWCWNWSNSANQQVRTNSIRAWFFDTKLQNY